jgi:hypothetical protein
VEGEQSRLREGEERRDGWSIGGGGGGGAYRAPRPQHAAAGGGIPAGGDAAVRRAAPEAGKEPGVSYGVNGSRRLQERGLGRLAIFLYIFFSTIFRKQIAV